MAIDLPRRCCRTSSGIVTPSGTPICLTPQIERRGAVESKEQVL
jgi:hypothetical protein